MGGSKLNWWSKSYYDIIVDIQSMNLNIIDHHEEGGDDGDDYNGYQGKPLIEVKVKSKIEFHSGKRRKTNHIISKHKAEVTLDCCKVFERENGTISNKHVGIKKLVRV